MLAGVVPHDTWSTTYEALRDRLAVAEVGATFLGGLVSDESIPKCTRTATANWPGDCRNLGLPFVP